jgi:choline dehydrogenase
VQETFDYVIVGAGSAGCVLANRLSANPSNRVLLLEAGPPDSNPWIHVPIGFYRTIFNPSLGWGYTTEPEPGTGDRAMSWVRGKVLGGSSSINGLLYVRGQHEDFDDWKALGNQGWGAADVLPYFKRSENQVRGSDAWHGVGGPLTVSDASHPDELTDAFVRAAGQAGLAHNRDFNGERQEGAGYYQLTTRKGRRASTAAAFLKPIRHRANLTVRTGALVSRVLMEGRRAVGVEYLLAGHLHRVAAAREVVLSGGAVNSPQLLQLSGIGPGALLQEHGVKPVHVLPGVGQNLQDHYNAYTLVKCRKPVTWNVQSRQWSWKLKAGLQFLLGGGPLSTGSARAGGFARTRPELSRPDVQFHFMLFTTNGKSAEMDRFSGFTLTVCQLRPESRGEVSIGSADFQRAPRILPRYLTHPVDQKTLVDGIRMSRRIVEAPALQPYVERVNQPDWAQSDEQLLDFARQTGRTVFHPCGTCKMGHDPMAVVDDRLRVHGIEGLRVADASIMPTLVSANTNAASIMIGEKASDLILKP